MIFEPFPQAGYLDQTLHLLFGVLLTTIFSYLGFSIFSILITMLIAFIREMIQHPFKLGPGSRTDLAFWFIGSIIGYLL